jgi:hypothetical protein
MTQLHRSPLPPPHDYATLVATYRESSGHYDETLSSRTIDDLVHVTDPEGYPVLTLNKHYGPEVLMGARVTQGNDGNYHWHLAEMPSEAFRRASHELYNTLLRFGRVDLERRFRLEIAQTDARLMRDWWRLVWRPSPTLRPSTI